MTTRTRRGDNIYDLFTGRPVDAARAAPTLVRVSPETDGLCALYSNVSQPGTLFTVNIVGWALYSDGCVDAIVPWLDGVCRCRELDNDHRGRWEGFHDPATDDAFDTAPTHKVTELESAAHWFADRHARPIVQEFTDPVGTHVLRIDPERQRLTLEEVVTWRLTRSGALQAMLADPSRIERTPVLPGDPCLFSVDELSERYYFFQHYAANQIKARDPDAMAALALLFND